MKTISGITSVKMDSPAPGSITIVATYEDKTFDQPSHRHTAKEYPRGNDKWYRGHRLTDYAFFIFRNGSKPIAILQKVLAQIGVTMENSLTWPPIFITQPANQSVGVGVAAKFSVETLSELPAELPVTYAWFESVDRKTWNALQDGGIYSGTATSSLGVTPVDKTKNDFLYLCKATNGSGTTGSGAAKLTID